MRYEALLTIISIVAFNSDNSPLKSPITKSNIETYGTSYTWYVVQLSTLLATDRCWTCIVHSLQTYIVHSPQTCIVQPIVIFFYWTLAHELPVYVSSCRSFFRGGAFIKMTDTWLHIYLHVKRIVERCISRSKANITATPSKCFCNVCVSLKLVVFHCRCTWLAYKFNRSFSTYFIYSFVHCFNHSLTLSIVDLPACPSVCQLFFFNSFTHTESLLKKFSSVGFPLLSSLR